jgi:hypothetical protein
MVAWGGLAIRRFEEHGEPSNDVAGGQRPADLPVVPSLQLSMLGRLAVRFSTLINLSSDSLKLDKSSQLWNRRLGTEASKQLGEQLQETSALLQISERQTAGRRREAEQAVRRTKRAWWSSLLAFFVGIAFSYLVEWTAGPLKPPWLP